MRGKNNFHAFPRIAISVLLIAVYLFPLYLLFVISFKTKQEFARHPFSFPTSIAISNYTEAIRESKYYLLLSNTTLITVVSLVLLMLFSTMAAYPITRNKNKISRFLYFFFVSGLMIPFQLIMLPLYKMIKDIGLMNTHLSIILIYVGASLPFLIFFYAGFIQNIPVELDEAARIDGASKIRVFRSIILPLMGPAILTVTVIQAIWLWNEFFIPMLFLKSYSKMTILVGVYSFVGERNIEWTSIFALISISIIPILIMQLVFQRYIIQGFLTGAIKG